MSVNGDQVVVLASDIVDCSVEKLQGSLELLVLVASMGCPLIQATSTLIPMLADMDDIRGGSDREGGRWL